MGLEPTWSSDSRGNYFPLRMLDHLSYHRKPKQTSQTYYLNFYSLLRLWQLVIQYSQAVCTPYSITNINYYDGINHQKINIPLPFPFDLHDFFWQIAFYAANKRPVTLYDERANLNYSHALDSLLQVLRLFSIRLQFFCLCLP